MEVRRTSISYNDVQFIISSLDPLYLFFSIVGCFFCASCPGPIMNASQKLMAHISNHFWALYFSTTQSTYVPAQFCGITQSTYVPYSLKIVTYLCIGMHSLPELYGAERTENQKIHILETENRTKEHVSVSVQFGYQVLFEYSITL